MGGCSSFEVRSVQEYTPDGCRPEDETCVISEGCCRSWEAVGCGGDEALGLNPECVPSAAHPECVDGNCMAYRRECSTGAVDAEGNPVIVFETKCEPLPVCDFNCIGVEEDRQPPDPLASWCFPAEFDSYLVSSEKVRYVDAGKCPSSPEFKSCVATCPDSKIATNGGCETLECLPPQQCQRGQETLTNSWTLCEGDDCPPPTPYDDCNL